MTTFIGFNRGDMEANADYGKDGVATNYTVTEIVPRSSADATGIRRVWIVQQGGGADDNNGTIWTFQAGVGWSSENTLVDGSISDMKAWVEDELPTVGRFLQATDADVSAFEATALAYPDEPPP